MAANPWRRLACCLRGHRPRMVRFRQSGPLRMAAVVCARCGYSRARFWLVNPTPAEECRFIHALDQWHAANRRHVRLKEGPQ